MILCDGNYGLGAHVIDAVHNREPERSRVTIYFIILEFGTIVNGTGSRCYLTTP